MTSDFERLLKQSPHFADVLNTHREATAQVIGGFIEALVQLEKTTTGDVLRTLKALDVDTGHPSIDSSRRRLVAGIRAYLQR